MCKLWIGLIGVIVLATTGRCEERLLPFADIKTFVEHHLAEKPRYKPGDIITRGDVRPIIARLAKAGVPIEGGVYTFDVFLPDQHPLVALLHAPKNLPVMRALGGTPESYDRLERLMRFPRGLKLVQEAFAEHDPVAAVKALCTPEAAAVLEDRFISEPEALNLDAVSGRVYTQSQLLEHIRTIHTLKEKNLTRPGD